MIDAAELAGMHPQTLRLYERRGLVQPQRTAKNTRRYSQRDVDRLRRIQELTDLGLNLAGVNACSPWTALLAMARALEASRRAAPLRRAPGFRQPGARTAAPRWCTFGRRRAAVARPARRPQKDKPQSKARTNMDVNNFSERAREAIETAQGVVRRGPGNVLGTSTC